jgi:4-amino-4-deoxy-L-arabinose transferase-like glycosyltransferase
MLHAMPQRAFAPSDDGSGGGGQALLLVLLAYFALQFALRLALGEGLELDEAEQALWTQRLALGYGKQPPLYTWLQWAVFQAVGVSLAGLALLKNMLLALTYVFTFLAARTLMPLPLAALASASMLLIPQIGWESQRDLTHSVVCTTMAAATLWLVLSLRERATLARYLLLGLVAGLGVLSKYSYAGFAAVLLLALLTAPDTRRVVLDRRFAAAPAVALLVVAPHAWWLLDHLGAAADGTLAKLAPGAGLSWVEGVLRGLGSMALAVTAFLTPLWIVLAALFVRRGWRDGVAPGPGCGLMRRYVAAFVLLLVALVVAGVAARFKDRWLQPFLFFAPLMFFACAPQLRHHPRLPWLRRVLLGWALAVLVLLALRAPFAGWRGQPDELNLPAQALARELADSGWDGLAIVSDDRNLAGVLRLQFPQAHVHVAGSNDGLPPPAQPALWVARGAGPQALEAIEAALGRPAPQATTVLLAPAMAPAGAAPLPFAYGWAP